MAWRALVRDHWAVYTVAIALTPLSSASAILQATPLVAAGAVLVFRETVSRRHWGAIAAGS